MLKVRDIALVCHEANRAYCKALGDLSQLAWEECPDWQKQSAIAGVQALIDDPMTGVFDLHEKWKQQKQKDGWVYGEVKNPEKKTHPCIVDYWDLPHEQQVKDSLFRSTAVTLLAAIEKEQK